MSKAATTRAIKSAMVGAFKKFWTSRNHPGVDGITRRFRKEGIERRKGSYTEDPSYRADTSSKELASLMAAAAKSAGARSVSIYDCGRDTFARYSVTAFTPITLK